MCDIATVFCTIMHDVRRAVKIAVCTYSNLLKYCAGGYHRAKRCKHY